MTEAESKRDLLQKFFFRDNLTGKFDELGKEEVEEEAEGGLELSLGLSLNGRFGIDPKRLKNLSLLRSSSVSDFVFTNGDGDGDGGGACTTEPSNFTAALERTRSLPPETEEEWRKRKETQSLRRMEAKRKRLEKMRSIKTARDHVVSEAYCEENGRIGEGHVSIGSPGIGSSGISESEPQQIQEGSTPSEARSPARVHSLPLKPNEQGQTLSIGVTRTASNSLAVNTDNKAKEMMKNMMVDMPCVSTRGIGPNGKRVEGFLYRYRKGEEVRIVCVCHGSFLSPAEFVKHAGGGDVLQPLKHIVVNPSPLL